MAKVAAVIVADSGEEAERQARTALGKGADLVELRMDHVQDLRRDTIRTLADSVGSQAIATLRSPAQGGDPRGQGSGRASLLKIICSERFAYVDLELETDREELEALAHVASSHRTKVLVSHHFPEAVDNTRISDAIDACAAQGDIAKVVVPVAALDGAIQLVELARARPGRSRPLVLIGTGAAGTLTRALADSLGQEIQYAAWESSTAPGQLSLEAACRLRGREPLILGLLGHPLEHSISPAIHEAAFAVLGLPSVYLPFDIPPDSLNHFLLVAEHLRIHGFNVTIPHKEAIVPRLDEVDEDAERVGAVNTVVLQDDRMRGHNTDLYAFRRSLKSLGLHVSDRKALVVGAGGASKAVVDVLLQEGARVHVTNRTVARADALADSFDEPIGVVPTEDLAKEGPWDLLVNATPVGMKGFPPALPVPEETVATAGFIYDLVYNPPITPLLVAAKRWNRPATSGLDMLLHQAAKSFELWTGQSPPLGAMARAAKEALG